MLNERMLILWKNEYGCSINEYLWLQMNTGGSEMTTGGYVMNTAG